MKNETRQSIGEAIIVATILLVVSMAIVATCCGCQGTGSTVQEFDAEGHLLKQTTTTESVIKEVIASTKGKTVIAWESGWAAYMSVSAATTEDPTPTGKLFAGKTDKGMISALPEQQNWAGIADAIHATKYELSAGKDGLQNK